MQKEKVVFPLIHCDTRTENIYRDANVATKYFASAHLNM